MHRNEYPKTQCIEMNIPKPNQMHRNEYPKTQCIEMNIPKPNQMFILDTGILNGI